MSTIQQLLSEHLSQGLNEISLPLSRLQQSSLLIYLGLLHKWNQVYNLTAIRDPKLMLTHHLLDTLAVVPLLDDWNKRGQAIRILDVGSGGGLPGIPWAIARPEWQLNLIDCVQKKTAFLTQAKIELGLKNLHVITGHVETLPNHLTNTPFDVLTCRAFSSLEQFLTLAGPWLSPRGLVVALKGEYPTQELKAIPNGWQVSTIQSINNISGLDAQRHVVLLSRIVNTQG